ALSAAAIMDPGSCVLACAGQTPARKSSIKIKKALKFFMEPPKVPDDFNIQPLRWLNKIDAPPGVFRPFLNKIERSFLIPAGRLDPGARHYKWIGSGVAENHGMLFKGTVRDKT